MFMLDDGCLSREVTYVARIVEVGADGYFEYFGYFVGAHIYGDMLSKFGKKDLLCHNCLSQLKL